MSNGKWKCSNCGTENAGDDNVVLWSSSTYASLTNYAWLVGFSGGYVSHYNKTNLNYVRCVR